MFPCGGCLLHFKARPKNAHMRAYRGLMRGKLGGWLRTSCAMLCQCSILVVLLYYCARNALIPMVSEWHAIQNRMESYGNPTGSTLEYDWWPDEEPVPLGFC